jgi:hypothetical protein
MKAALRRAGYNDQRELATKLIIDDQSAMPDIGGNAAYKTKVVIFNLACRISGYWCRRAP